MMFERMCDITKKSIFLVSFSSKQAIITWFCFILLLSICKLLSLNGIYEILIVIFMRLKMMHNINFR